MHTSPGRSIDLPWLGPFPKYGLPLHRYSDWASAKSQNVWLVSHILYCIKGHLVLHGKSCSSIAKSKLGMWHFLQFSIKQSHTSEIKQNLSVCILCLRLKKSSNLRCFMIFWYLLAHGISKDWMSPFLAPKLLYWCIVPSQHASSDLETYKTLQLIEV